MRAAVIHPRRWSLRTRLVVAVVALLAVVCTLVGVATSLALQRYQLRQLDASLRAAAGRAPRDFVPFQFADRQSRCGATSASASGIGFLEAPGQATGTLAARLSSSGTVSAVGYLDSAGCTHLLQATSATGLNGLGSDSAPQTRAVGSLGDYRVVAVRGSDGQVLVTGLPLAGMRDTQRRLVEVEVVVSVLALAVAGLAAAAIVRGALRPLRRVAGTATRVSAMPLDRGEVALAVRVPAADTDPRTEVGQVGAALNRLLGHVGSALSARQESEVRVRQFVADASHELRTPLASIRGYAELINRDPALGQTLHPAAAHALGRVESEAVRMTGLVEDLLLLARLDAGRPLEQEAVDMTRLVLDAVSDASAAGRDHTWRIDVPDEPVVVTGDAGRLHQVLVNLLTNARTHTPPGTTVTASLAVSAGKAGIAGTAVLAVLDDGPGIAPALLPHVFDRFARGDSSRSRAAGSSGLGLAIVSAIITASGGSVDVTSRPGQTAFLVRLPARPPEQQPS